MSPPGETGPRTAGAPLPRRLHDVFCTTRAKRARSTKSSLPTGSNAAPVEPLVWRTQRSSLRPPVGELALAVRGETSLSPRVAPPSRIKRGLRFRRCAPCSSLKSFAAQEFSGEDWRTMSGARRGFPPDPVHTGPVIRRHCMDGRIRAFQNFRHGDQHAPWGFDSETLEQYKYGLLAVCKSRNAATSASWPLMHWSAHARQDSPQLSERSARDCAATNADRLLHGGAHRCCEKIGPTKDC